MALWNIFTSINAVTFLCAAVTFLLVYLWRRNPTRRGLPPGPFAFPLVGSLPFVGQDIRAYFHKVSVTYGDVFTVYLGLNPTVVFNNYDVLREAFITHAQVFSSRPSNMEVFERIIRNRGIVLNHSSWQEQRRFAHRVLRDLGMGKSVLQDKILEEIATFREQLVNNKDRAYDPGELLHSAVTNIICSILFGSRFEYTDPDFQHIQHITHKAIVMSGAGRLVSVFPWLRHLPGDLFRIKEYIQIYDDVQQWIGKHIQRHKRSAGGAMDTESFVGAYLKKIEEDRKANGNEATFDEGQLLISCEDILGGGSETTATALRWAIAYMVHYPDIQRKIHHELDNVIGREAVPVITDRMKLPYTDACLSELLRYASILPLSLAHSTTEDVVFRGHTIPKGTSIMMNLHSVHRDNTWETPEAFNPGHFLSPEGEVKRNEHLIPFSLGKRVCLGESLARMELFLFFTSILQKFTLVKDEDEGLPDLEGVLGLTYAPKPYRVIFRERLDD